MVLFFFIYLFILWDMLCIIDVRDEMPTETNTAEDTTN